MIKKYIVLLFLGINAVSTVYCQPGKSYFPFISFFDHYVNAKMGVEPWGRLDTVGVYGRVKGVYDLMKAAGITHTVTLLNSYTSNPTNNPGIKIFDRHIEWSAISTLPISGSNNPGKYILSQGQEENSYSFEIGDNSSISLSSLTKANNFGFGRDAGTQSSVWFMSNNSNLIPSWVDGNINGSPFNDIDGDLGITVRRATTRTTGGGYYMVYGIVNRMMFTRDRQHYMKIKAKLDISTLPSSTPVFTVKVKIKPYVTNAASRIAGKQNANPVDTFATPVDSPPEVVIEMPVLKSSFTSPGNYEWIEITHPHFRRNNTFNEVGKEIEIGIFFENNIAVNVDKLVIQDEDYREYVSNTALRNEITNAINGKINSYATDPLFESNYYDEPYMLTAKIRRDYQHILRTGSGGTRMDLNGATGGYWKWHLAFDIDKVSNNFFYRHSLLYDWYPLKRKTPNGFGKTGNQSALQKAFDDMIVYKREPVLKGSDTLSDQMQHMGYIAALDASQNFTANVLSDDIPLFHTIQVAASRVIKREGSGFTYVTDDTKLRAPSREEIHTMGNLAIAYGAKGLMFYMVPTRIPNIPTADGAKVEATYGLFDNPGNLYDDAENAQVCKSRGDLEQNGNYRYFAVEEFTERIKGIEKFILRTHWVNGFNGETNTHRIPGAICEWINSIKSKNSITGVDDSTSFTEAGLFKYTTGSAQGSVTIIPDTILIYLVNRFCDETDTLISTTVKRDITVNLKHLNLPYSNYSVVDLSDTTYPVIASLSEGMIDSLRKFTVSLYGGEGCMLMITPTIYTGGEFRQDETIHKNEVIKKTLHMKNHKLTIANGVSLEFQNASKLIVEDGQLVIGDNDNTNITLNFINKNWSENNGVFCYRSPVRIKNATIKNASCGLYSHISPGDIIDGLKTDNTHTGISLYYSYNNGIDNTIIRNSQFTNTQLWGITMVGSKPVLHDNTFHNSEQTGTGIRAVSGSRPQLLDTLLEDGENKFENLVTSIYSLNSGVLLGRAGLSGYLGKNCFLGDITSLELISEDMGETEDIDAYGNDWGSDSPDKFRIVINGNYDVHTAGYNNYCSQQQNKIAYNKFGNRNKSNSIESDSIKTIFIGIQNLINIGEKRQARELINGLVSGETSASCKKKAVKLLPLTYEETEIRELKTELLRIRQTGTLFKSTTMLLLNIDTENMDTYKQEILNAGNNKMYGSGDNSEQVMMIYNNLLEEKYNSSGIIDTVGVVTPMLTYLNSNFPSSEYTKSANLLFSDLPDNSLSNGALNKQQPNNSKSESVIYEYKLFNNYPNPFNPETVVEYSVKEKSDVTLSIYDILGRKIYEVEQPGINSGRYDMRWQGTNKYGEKVSSGVYILEMRAKSLESSTEYRSSIKLLLAK